MGWEGPTQSLLELLMLHTPLLLVFQHHRSWGDPYEPTVMALKGWSCIPKSDCVSEHL